MEQFYRCLSGFYSPFDWLDCNGHPDSDSQCNGPTTSSICAGSLLRVARQTPDPATSRAFNPLRRARPRGDAAHHSTLRNERKKCCLVHIIQSLCEHFNWDCRSGMSGVYLKGFSLVYFVRFQTKWLLEWIKNICHLATTLFPRFIVRF